MAGRSRDQRRVHATPLIAILYGYGHFTNADATLSKWAVAHNPFYDGRWSDGLSLLPYVLLCGFLFLVAREKLLAPRRNVPR